MSLTSLSLDAFGHLLSFLKDKDIDNVRMASHALNVAVNRFKLPMAEYTAQRNAINLWEFTPDQIKMMTVSPKGRLIHKTEGVLASIVSFAASFVKTKSNPDHKLVERVIEMTLEVLYRKNHQARLIGNPKRFYVWKEDSSYAPYTPASNLAEKILASKEFSQAIREKATQLLSQKDMYDDSVSFDRKVSWGWGDRKLRPSFYPKD